MAVDTHTAEAGHEAGHDHATSLGLSNNKMAMWTLIGSECLFFGAMIATYLLYVGRSLDGPGPVEIFDIPFTSVSTFVLLMSSLSMVLALAAIQVNDLRRFRVWTLATALLGASFIAGQFYEFTLFVDEGMKIETSPFSASFFVLTGFHGLHVAFGVVMLFSLWSASLSGKITSAQEELVENIGLYWHFVDIVWIVIFTAIYLIPAG